MSVTTHSMLHADLSERRRRLVSTIPHSPDSDYLQELLGEVDAALARIDDGSYGLCEVCLEPVERDRLMADPLTRLCLDHLNPRQQRALEQDLGLAAQVQAGLLPPRDLRIGDWQVAYSFQPAGLVSGDYCDIVRQEDGSFHFLLGDVSGKGVAASMLMSHLNALFRTLIAARHPLGEVVERASRAFCESTLPTHFATLVCGQAWPDGQVEICNAGHPPPLLAGEKPASTVDGAGLPLGLFQDSRYTTRRIQLSPGETLLLYTDGLLEATDGFGSEYGLARAKETAGKLAGLSSRQIVEALAGDLETFRGGKAADDDTAVMALQRVA